MQLPTFIYPLLVISLAMYGVSYFICNDALVDTSGHGFQVMYRLASFTGCGLNGFVMFLAFIFNTLPWILILLNFVVELAQTSVTGAVILALSVVGFLTYLAF